MKKTSNSSVKFRNPVNAEEFDYSKIDPALSVLAKPAQRALVNNGVFTVRDLAKRTLKEVLSFHGMGKASIPLLQKILRKKGLKFKG